MIALILAAGTHAKWWKGSTLKQLTLINGEPLIVRTVRQLEERGVMGVVVTHKPEIIMAVPRYLEPEQREFLPSTVLSTRNLWEDRTLILLGDVVWDPKALDKVVSSSGLHFYGSTKGKWEVFAFGFDLEHHIVIEEACRNAIAWGRAGNRARAWEIYRSLAGISLDHIRVFDGDIWFDVKESKDSDYTRDLDTLEDLQYFGGKVNFDEA